MAYTKEQFRNIFQNKFDRDAWKTILTIVFGAQKVRNETERFTDGDASEIGYYVGQAETPDNFRIGLFYYKINSGSVAHKKVGLRNLVKEWIHKDKGEFDAAIVVFDDGKDWRLSFVCDIKEEATAPKRFTFVFGEKDNFYRTAIDRFTRLQGQKPTFENIRKAFSVEALSDDFFDQYRELYADFVQYITGKRYVKESNKWVERKICNPNYQYETTFGGQDKLVRDYIKKMFGRIVFLYFLQRKGWLDGNRQYMHDLFYNSNKKANFLDDVLEILFFEVLNTDKPYRTDKAKSMSGSENIPYLNGGLFAQDDIDALDCIFPEDYFRRLFDFLDSYNFTIDENDTDDAEIGIDPEMLGRIFENLLEDNKDKGAFYTPKEIVDYMCRESIIAYLLNGLPDRSHDLIRRLVETFDASELNDEQRLYIRKKLQSVKICDPAIGSGAFPMGLVNLLSKLYVAMKSDTDTSKMKRYIMEQSIYGVDIEPGAVDIARLRFWLAMIVEEEEPIPLPNLHFKIMHGNSLLETYNGIDLSDLTKISSQSSLFDSDNSERESLISSLMSYYKTSDHAQRDRLFTDIIHNVRRQLFDKGITLPQGLDPSANTGFFLWHTWFSDVFAKGGFDIVIGNPPYLNVERMSLLDKKLYKNMYRCFYKRSDIFALFIELSLKLSNSKGIVTMIVPSVVHSNLSYSKLRDIILNQHWLQEVCYTGGDVFDAPIVDTTILRCNKSGVNEIILKRALNFNNPTTNVVGKDFFKDYKNIISIEDNSKYSVVLEKLFNKSFTKVEELYSVFQGIVTGNNPVFIFDTKEDANGKIENYLLHPMCHGRDIERYLIRSRERNIAYLNNNVNIANFPFALKWLEAKKEELSKRREVKKGVIKWYSLQWPRVKSELDIKEKILIQNTRNESLPTRLVGALDTEGVYGTQGLNFIIPKNDKVSLRFLLGILNSKLLNFLFSTKFLNLAIKADYIKQVRIPEFNSLVESYVNEINSAKLSGTSTDAMETEIDHIVYHLYGLTYDEVLIVDPQTPITREEYESYNMADFRVD